MVHVTKSLVSFRRIWSNSERVAERSGKSLEGGAKTKD